MSSVAEPRVAFGGPMPDWAQVETAASSFRRYVNARKYDYGRGTAAAWAFIAFARGDRGFPDVRSWSELQVYLERTGAGRELLQPARSVWRSFTAYRSRARQRGSDGSSAAAW